MMHQYQHLIQFVDLTNLSHDVTIDTLDALSQKAHTQHVAAICVQKEYVAVCSELLDVSDVLVASVFNFPDGNKPFKTILQDIDMALTDGVNECDIVIPLKSLEQIQDPEQFTDSVASFVNKCRCAYPVTQTTLKFIIATDVLKTKTLIQAATKAVIQGGGDFVKTCTGKHGGGVTLEAIKWMCDTIASQKSDVGIKVSGGIKTPKFAQEIFACVQHYHQHPLTPQQFRIGASSLLEALQKEDK